MSHRLPSVRSPHSGGRPRAGSRLVGLALLALCCGSASAFDELSATQALIYDNAHLTNTATGDELVYRYVSMLPDGESMQGEVIASITGASDGDKRDVSIEFLDGEAAMVLPDFSGYRGNPVIIAMLEHVARSLGEQTGGGALYFRNRIRDALANPSLAIVESDDRFGDSAITVASVEFTPFVNDPYLNRFPAIAASRFTLTMSESVPGEVVNIEISAPGHAQSDDAGDEQAGFQALLSLRAGD